MEAALPVNHKRVSHSEVNRGETASRCGKLPLKVRDGGKGVVVLWHGNGDENVHAAQRAVLAHRAVKHKAGWLKGQICVASRSLWG